MRILRQWITSFFGFSRSETNGFMILLPLMAIAIAAAPMYRWWIGQSPADDITTARLDSLVARWKWEKYPDSTTKSLQRFAFDPNTASLEQLQTLGFSQPLSQRLINYRTKGGRFRTRDDLRKLYGMDSILMRQLHRYIVIPQRHPIQTGSRVRRIKSGPFDLNLADTVQLVRLYGIGPSLSRRIVRYRDRLGGFVSLNQLHEVFGLDSAAIDELKKRTFIEPSFRPRMINLNQADEKNLHFLPYINFHLAKSIAAYRFQHGGFTSIDDLLRLELMNDSIFQKIKPYLTVQD